MDVLTYQSVYEMDFPDRITVRGEGNPHAKIMLISTAPDQTEEKQERLYVGEVGRRLDELLLILGLNRDQLFLTSLFKYRLTETLPTGNLIDRSPTDKEIAESRRYIRHEMQLVSPKLIITFGKFVCAALLGDEPPLAAIHGKPQRLGESFVCPLYDPLETEFSADLRKAYTQDLIRLKIFSTELVIR